MDEEIKKAALCNALGMIEDPAVRKFIIAGAVVAILALVILTGFGSVIAGQSSSKAIAPKESEFSKAEKPTPKGIPPSYTRVKLAEFSGRIFGLGKNNLVRFYISGKNAAYDLGHSFSRGNGKWHEDFSSLMERGEEPENLNITIKPMVVPKGFKPVPEQYKFSISKGERIEDVNFCFVKQEK